MKTTSILTAVLLGLGTAGVLAQDGGDQPGGPRGPRGQGGPGGAGGPGQGRPNPAEMLKRLDKDGDGKISKEEAPERMAEHFDVIDKNSDGYITVDELRPPGGQGGPEGQGRPNPGQILKRLDKDGDGKISKEEAPERMAANFDKLDKNSDGYLTPDELPRPAGPGGPAGPGREGDGFDGPRGPRAGGDLQPGGPRGPRGPRPGGEGFDGPPPAPEGDQN